MPPMAEREHELQSRYDRLDDQIGGNAIDAIVIHPRSSRSSFVCSDQGFVGSVWHRTDVHLASVAQTCAADQEW
jgi:hypothetical protein